MPGPYDFGFTIDPLYQIGRQSVLPAFLKKFLASEELLSEFACTIATDFISVAPFSARSSP
jgi:hypothetical protein